MRKDKKWILMSVVFLVIGIAVIWTAYEGAVGTESEKVTVDEATDETTEVVENTEGPLTKESETVFENAQFMVVEKVVRRQIENVDGSIETYYDSYLLSDIDLVGGEVVTTDYSQASVGEGIEMEQAKITDFESEFGFTVSGLNGLKIYEQLLAVEGITGALNQVSVDKTAYDMTGQKIYVLENECEVTNNLLQGVEYDKLIATEVSYQIIETKEQIMIPDFFTATVQYQVGKQVITKNLFLQITINSEK